jgi:tRNA 2-thiouridine synthesizing protein D
VKVFFYGEGIHNANGFIIPASDEKNMMRQWRNLAEQYGVQLIVCNTAANKRGVISEEEAQSQNAFNLQDPFNAGGLAEFASMSQSSDRLVQF